MYSRLNKVFLSKRGCVKMARFYDSANESDLSRVEELLKRGGIEYSLRIPGEGAKLREIVVAEEDLVFAEVLLNDSSKAGK